MLISSSETPTEGGAGVGVGICSGSMITACVEFVKGCCAGVFSGDIGVIARGVVEGSSTGRNDGSETCSSGKLHEVMTPAKSSGIQYFVSMIREALELEIMGSVRFNSSQHTNFWFGFRSYPAGDKLQYPLRRENLSLRARCRRDLPFLCDSTRPWSSPANSMQQ